MKRYEVTPLPGYDLVIGRWLWAMQQTRKRTLRLVKDLDEDLLDWGGRMVGRTQSEPLLYHIAGVEMRLLWWELKGHSGMPPEIEEDFPSEAADPETGWLTRVRGIPLAEHVRRLERNREVFLAEVKGLSPERLANPATGPEHRAYAATPEWMLFHLIAHEAEHNEQISSLKCR